MSDEQIGIRANEAGILLLARRRVERHTMLMVTISPLAFLTFRSFIKKYQNLDLATTVLGANMRMR